MIRRPWIVPDVHRFYVRVFVPAWLGGTIVAFLAGWRL